MRDVLIAFFVALAGVPFFVTMLEQVSAQAMESDTYRIQSDSINFGGGLATSSSYSLESTAGEIATGESASDNYSLKAGYQQMHEVYLAMTSPADVIMSPAIGGVSGGVSNGSTTVTVTTDGAAGYTLSIQAENSPAMQSDLSTIDDYAPVGADPDFSFITDATDAQFGYSPEGADVVQRFLDDGASCNTGSGETAASCWDGLATTGEDIAASGGANHPLGTETEIHFRVGIGGSVGQLGGTYVATTTLTALPL